MDPEERASLEYFSLTRHLRDRVQPLAFLVNHSAMNEQLTPRLIYVACDLLHNFYQKVRCCLNSQRLD